MAEEVDQAGSSSSARAGVKLFLGGLSWETSEEKIRRHFEQYGEVDEVIVMRDAMTKKPRGFGFITFKEPDVADSVCREQHILDNRQIDAKHSVPQEQKPKSKKIFVGGLAPDTNEGQFRSHFEQFGAIADAQIMQDHLSGRSRGFGFVTFEEDSSVEKVFALGTMHDLSGKKVEVKTATPRGSGSLTRGVTAGRGIGRPIFPGRGLGFEGELDSSQGTYSIPYGSFAGYPGMVPGYQLGYQSAYGYIPYGYGFPHQFHPGYAQSFDPRQTPIQYGGRGYQVGPRSSSGPIQLPQRPQQ